MVMLNLYRINTQVPLCVVVAWIMGIHMDLDFNILETTSLALSIIATAFTLQVRIFMSQKLPLSTFGDNSFEHYKLLLVPISQVNKKGV